MIKSIKGHYAMKRKSKPSKSSFSPFFISFSLPFLFSFPFCLAFAKRLQNWIQYLNIFWCMKNEMIKFSMDLIYQCPFTSSFVWNNGMWAHITNDVRYETERLFKRRSLHARSSIDNGTIPRSIIHTESGHKGLSIEDGKSRKKNERTGIPRGAAHTNTWTAKKSCTACKVCIHMSDTKSQCSLSVLNVVISIVSTSFVHKNVSSRIQFFYSIFFLFSWKESNMWERCVQ